MSVYVKYDSIYEELKNYIDGLEIIDSHEHLPAFEDRHNPRLDVLGEYLTQYFPVDLVSAGLPRADLNKMYGDTLSIPEKWKLLEPYWDTARNTGYGQLLDISAKALYGIERIDGGSIEELNAKFVKARKEGGRYKRILKDMCHIKTSVLDDLANPGGNGPDEGITADREFFTSVCRIDPWIELGNCNDLDMLERLSGARIAGFKDLLDACENYFKRIYSQGIRILKCAVAYSRPLKFERRTYSEAEAAFNRLLSMSRGCDVLKFCGEERKYYEDYMLHFILSFANRNGMTIQIHTGIQEGNANILTHSNPSLLENLFPEYPYVTFDIFHISYPYQNALGVYAKMYPNVFIDMCWAHAISPSASREALYGWLDTVPSNKISAFGGDFSFIDAVYGHLVLARRNVALVLAAKVRDGDFDIEKARHTAQMLFYTNPGRVFKII